MYLRSENNFYFYVTSLILIPGFYGIKDWDEFDMEKTKERERKPKGSSFLVVLQRQKPYINNYMTIF